MSDVEESIRELRLLTECRCVPPYPLSSGKADPDCLEIYREEVETLAAELARVGPVVAAAEALVEQWDQAPAASRDRASEVFDDHADGGLGDRLDALSEKVKVALDKETP